jgi:hypothetical protein
MGSKGIMGSKRDHLQSNVDIVFPIWWKLIRN